MDRVSIKFAKGKLEIRDAKGKPVETNRATVYLVRGNEVPVALIETSEGTREHYVSSLDCADAAPVAAEGEVVEEGKPKAKT